MPDTRHHWRLWHILQKLPRKLDALEKYQEFKDDLLEVVYDSLTPEAFERGWDEVIGKYDLGANERLFDLFQERQMWAPTYMKDIFWAGMRTTQRVESINSLFDQFITRHTRLCEFGERYCVAIKKRICQERDADAKGGKWVRKLLAGFKIEKMYRKIYIDAMFRKIQIECERLAYCYVREENVLSDSKIHFILEDRIWVTQKGCTEAIITDKRTMIGVLFDTETREATCDCKTFETSGLLCRHLIKVFDQNLVDPLPEKYILRWWRKDIPRKHLRITVAYHEPSKTLFVKRCDKMTVDFESLCDLAGEDDEATEIVRAVIRNTKKLIVERLRNKEKANETSTEVAATEDTSTKPFTESSTVEGEMNCLLNTPSSTNQSATNSIRDPPIKKKRGRPQTTRYLTAGEKEWQKGPKDSEAEPKLSEKGKSKNQTGKGKGKEQGASHVQADGPPSKLKVNRGVKSVSFSNETRAMCTGSQSAEFICRNSLVFDDTMHS